MALAIWARNGPISARQERMGATSMTDAALSYAHGTSHIPLIGETIGAILRSHRGALGRSAGADRPPAGHAVDLSRVGRTSRCVRRRPDRAGAAAGRARRHLVAEQRRMGGDPVRHRQGRADPGEHQSGLPAGRAGIRAEQGRLPRAGHRDVVQDQSDYVGMLNTLAPELRARIAGQLRRRQAARS